MKPELQLYLEVSTSSLIYSYARSLKVDDCLCKSLKPQQYDWILRDNGWTVRGVDMRIMGGLPRSPFVRRYGLPADRTVPRYTPPQRRAPKRHRKDLRGQGIIVLKYESGRAHYGS